ncbi:MAG: hypothetical protein AB1515_08350 [Nitrospirota bacterium]
MAPQSIRRIKAASGILCLAIAMHVATAGLGRAIDFEFDPGLTQALFKDLGEEAGLAVSYMPAAPAEPLGFPGFDIGIEATATSIDSDDAHWQLAFSGDPPDFLVVPKLRARVGLPFGIDIGAVYSSIPYIKAGLLGGEVKWAALKGGAVMPAVAVRGAYTTLLSVDELDLTTYSADLSISKGFLIFTPYAGVGQVWIQAEEKSAAVALSDERISKTRGFVGLQIGVPLVSFLVEAAFASVPSYTARLSVGF